MKSLGFGILFSVFVFLGDMARASSTEILAQGLSAVATGELSDSTLIRQLTGIAKVGNHKDRILASYLLTYALGIEGTTQAIRYVNYLLSQKDTETYLGKEAFQRLYRLKGDDAYEHVKFKVAIEAYSNLIAVTDGALKDYAMLRLGWSYLNQDKAEQAYHLWLDYLRSNINRERGLSNNILHGIGQALTENTKRTDADFEELGDIPFSEVHQREIASGIRDGLFFLNRDRWIEVFARQLGNLSWNGVVVDAVIEGNVSAGREACQLASVLEVQANRPIEYEKAHPILEQCFSVIRKWTKLRKYRVRLDNLFPRLVGAEGIQRSLAYRFFSYRGRVGEACKQGVYWMVEGKEKNSKQIPVNKIVRHCQRWVKKSKGPSLEFVQLNHGLVTQDEKKFQQIGSPLVYLNTKLMRYPLVRENIWGMMRTAPPVYQNTILPALLAERLLTTRQIDQAAALRKAYYIAGAGGEQDEVWEEVASKRLVQLIVGGKLMEAQTQIDEIWPLNTEPGKLTKNNLNIWMSLLVKSSKDASHEAWVKERVRMWLRFAQGNESAKVASSLVELGVTHQLWSELWQALSHYSSKFANRWRLSPKLSVGIFEAIVGGKIEPEGFTTLKTASLKHTVVAGLKLREEQAAFPKLVFSKKSILRKDANFLSILDRKKRFALRRRKEALEEMTRWSDFLGYASNKIRSRKWISSVFQQQGIRLLGGFCKEAGSRSTQLTRPTGISEDRWKPLMGNLYKNIRACDEWVARQIKTKEPKVNEKGTGDSIS